MKNEKNCMGFLIHKILKIWSISLEHFVERKPLISEECTLIKIFFSEESIDLLQHEQEGTFENALFTATVVGLLRSGYGLPEELMIKYAHLKYSAGGY